MKKHILFTSEALWIGGIETALLNLLNRINYDKYDVTLLLQWAIFDGNMRQQVPSQCRIITCDRSNAAYRYNRLYHLTEASENPSRLHRAMMWAVPVIKWVENRLYIRYIREHMKAEHFDTCVIYSDRTAEIAVRAVRADKYLMFYHHGAMRKAWHDEIGYRKAARIIAVSKGVEEKLRAFRPKYAHKMTTVHNLIDIEGICAKADVSIPESFDKTHCHIVSCGRVSYEKGMDLAVETCAKLVSMGHKNIHWWIVGGGPAEEDVRRKIAELHMEDYVTMLGMKVNPYPYIKKADLYVQPSRFEGYPMTILEALILGQPVISTDNSGAKEIIVSNETGLLCDTNPDSLSLCISKLLSNRAILDALRACVQAQKMDQYNLSILDHIQHLL